MIIGILPPGQQDALARRLNVILAISWDYTARIKNAHHNAGRANFYFTHKMYDSFFNGAPDDGGYQPLSQYSDNIAERLTTLGARAQETLAEMAANSLLPDFPTDIESAEQYNLYMAQTAVAAWRACDKFMKDFAAADDTSCGRVGEFKQALEYHLMYLQKILSAAAEEE